MSFGTLDWLVYGFVVSTAVIFGVVVTSYVLWF